jgi:hypothetical protein
MLVKLFGLLELPFLQLVLQCQRLHMPSFYNELQPQLHLLLPITKLTHTSLKLNSSNDEN